MKLVNKIYKILAGFVFILTLFSQNSKIMIAYATQTVVKDTLHIDISIKRIVQQTFSLGSANFSLYLNNNALDLANAQFTEMGPWSMDFTPADYSGPDYLYKDNFFTVNILPITASSGSGVSIDTSYMKVCRLSIPITDASQTNTLQWRIDPIAIHKWTYENITDSIIFLIGNPTTDLCFAPEKPTVSASKNIACQQAVIYIDSTNALEYEVYKNGILMTTINTDSFVVNSSGAYYVIAKNYSCGSNQSNIVNITIENPLTAPVITLVGDSLVCSNCSGQDIQTYQWLFNGNPITGANSHYIKNLTPGTYQLKIINSCGEEISNTYTYIPTGVSLSVKGTKLLAYPVPTDKELNISLSGTPDTEVELGLFNILGEKVSSIYKGKLNSKVKNLIINTSQLSSGVYFIKGKISGEFVSLKIVTAH